MTDLALRVEGLSKRYHIGKSRGLFERFNASTFQRSNDGDTLWALKDVSFEVKRGEVVGIIGRNGAGNPRRAQGQGAPCSRFSPASPSPLKAAPSSTAG